MFRSPNSQIVAVVATLLMSGCAMNRQQEALEVRLREHESTIRDLRSQISKAERTLEEQDQELVVERSRNSGNSELASNSAPFSASGVTQAAFTPEVHAAWGSVVSIEIHRMTSGLLQSDGESGRSLNVVVQSLDSDGELVKTSGTMTLTASTVTDDGTTQQIAHTSYSITESRRLWTRSFVASGFHMNIPLDSGSAVSLEKGDRILVTATLDLGQDRSFSTSELLDVSL